MLPAAVMVLMSVWEQLLSPKRTACQAMLFILLTCASGAAVCCWQGWVTNTLLLPFMALAFVLFRRALKPNVSLITQIEAQRSGFDLKRKNEGADANIMA